MRLVAWLPLALALSCGSQKPPALTVKLAHAAANGLCFPAGPRPSDEALTSAQISLLRLTVRAHAPGDATGSFQCDRVLNVPGDQPELQLPADGEQSVDLYGEAFLQATADDPDTATVGPWRRVATGSLVGVDVHGTTLATLRLYPSRDFRCVDARLGQARAFHSATPLPNGQVLIVGGLVASPSDAAQEVVQNNAFFVTSSIELYDPADGSFTPLADPGITGRAFHSATLLGQGPPYQILLIGGVASADPTGQMPQLEPNTGAAQDAARFAPEIPGLVPTPLPTIAAPPELLVFDPSTKTLTLGTPVPRIPPGAFHGTAPLSDGVAVAGGMNWGAMGTPDLSQANLLYATSGTQVHAAQLSTQRIGTTLSLLGGDQALVWGGELTATDLVGKPTPPGDLITGLSSPAPMALSLMPGTQPRTLFHTATTFSVGAMSASVLVTGGFLLQSGSVAIQPPPGSSSLFVLTTSGQTVTPAPVGLDGYVADPTCNDPNRYRPAGYESALALAGRDGEVLVGGGSPSFGACNDCETGTIQGPLCSLHQASLFQPPATLSQLPPMQVGRFGHTSTPLLDGTVLIAGGVELPAGATAARLVGDAEVYNPRARVPRFAASAPAANDRDDPIYEELNTLGLARAPGDVARDPALGNAPAHPCPSL
jgi:hypothetical protein